MVARGELTEGHARAVLALPDHDARKRLAKRIVRDGMSVRAAEKAAQDGGAARRPRAASAQVDPALAERARGAAERLTGLPARVAAGKLEIHFGEELRLEELVEVLESLAVKRAGRVGDPGFEPGTSALSERRSNQLS